MASPKFTSPPIPCGTCRQPFTPDRAGRVYCSRACWRLNPPKRSNTREYALKFVAFGSDDECWPWQGWRQKHGYGRISISSRRHLVKTQAVEGGLPSARDRSGHDE